MELHESNSAIGLARRVRNASLRGVVASLTVMAVAELCGLLAGPRSLLFFRIGQTTMLACAASAGCLVCSVHIGRTRLVGPGGSGIGLAIAAAVLSTPRIWFFLPYAFFRELPLLLLCAAAFIIHALGLLSIRLAGRHAWLRWVTLCAASLLAFVSCIAILAETGARSLVRLEGTLLVLVGCGTLSLLALAGLDTPARPVPTVDATVRPAEDALPDPYRIAGIPMDMSTRPTGFPTSDQDRTGGRAGPA